MLPCTLKQCLCLQDCTSCSSSPSRDMSSNFCPGRRISNAAGKVISGTAIYWPGCWHSTTAEITYCQSSVRMTGPTVRRATLCKLESPSRVVMQTFPWGIKLFCFHFVTVAIMCQNRNGSAAAAVSGAYAGNTLCIVVAARNRGPVLELCAVRRWSNSLSQ